MPLKVIVIGGGIGGPVAAAALARQGHQVTILERSNLEKQVGFAFRITENSDRCLKYLGIDTAAGGAVIARYGKIMNGETGKVLHEFDENQDEVKAKQAASVFAFRPQVADQLFDVCHKLGVKVRLGIKIKDIDVEESEVLLQDGATMSADLIIGADGVHSTVRPHIVDTTIYKPKPTLEINCFRFMVPASAFATDELLSTLSTGGTSMFSWRTDEMFMILYPVDFGQQYNVVCTHPARLSDGEISHDSGSEISQDYNQSVSLEAALEIYKDFEPRARRVFELADPNGFRIWKLQDMDDIPQWSKHTTVVIGDAAHAVLPFSFSGASMAIEDGIFLSELMPSGITKADIPSTLRLFEQSRKPRIERVRETGRSIGQGNSGPEFTDTYKKFLTGYDTVTTAKQVLKSRPA